MILINKKFNLKKLLKNKQNKVNQSINFTCSFGTVNLKIKTGRDFDVSVTAEQQAHEGAFPRPRARMQPHDCSSASCGKGTQNSIRVRRRMLARANNVAPQQGARARRQNHPSLLYYILSTDYLTYSRCVNRKAEYQIRGYLGWRMFHCCV